MISAVITGGIATGKSSFVAALRAIWPGMVVFSADESVREAYERPEVVWAVCKAVGLDPVRPADEDGAALRAVIRGIVTQDAAAKKRLEEVLHPMVFQAAELARSGAEQRQAGVFLAEVPLYYETGRRYAADMVVVVAASRETQLRRLVTSRGLDQTSAERLLAVQFPLSDKIAQADKLVWNEGSEGLLKQQAVLLRQQFVG